jgi:adenylate cyclase
VAATRRLAAIMFTDMVGYTTSTQTDEEGTLKLLREQEEFVRPLFATYHGREIKSTGDGFLVEFDSALRGVQCAVDVLQRLAERNARPGVTPIQLRIGIHLGDVEERGGDIFGDAVNIASRIEPLAPPGGVCISGPVFDQVRNKIPNAFERLPPSVLKNVRVPVEVYRVGLTGEGSVPATASTSWTRLAVLPLANISPDPKDEYFADGLTEELISALSKIQDLRVIARTSVGQYKSGAKSIAQIGAELDVGVILEGSVRKAGNRLRITLQLISARTQEHIWAESYDRELDDVFAIQTDIADRTAGALRLELLGPARRSITKKPTSDLVAYDLYLKGIHAAHQSGAEGAAPGIRFFEEAIQKDPSFSLAYSHLANTYLLLAGDAIEPREAYPRARDLTAKALDLDPRSSDAHTARGNLALQCDQDWGVSENEFQRAISLNPSNANAHFWYAMLLRVLGRFDEAIDELTTAIELDPLWGLPRLWRTTVYEESGDLPSALACAEEEGQRDPGNPVTHIDLGELYLRTGRREDARREAEKSAGATGLLNRMNRAVLWAALGNLEEARSLLAELEAVSSRRFVQPTWRAVLYAALGTKEKALEWLERDVGSEYSGFWLDYPRPVFDSLREDPRFQSLLRRQNLPTRGQVTSPEKSS